VYVDYYFLEVACIDCGSWFLFQMLVTSSRNRNNDLLDVWAGVFGMGGDLMVFGRRFGGVLQSLLVTCLCSGPVPF